MLRKLRGIVGMGITWAVVWAALGAALGLVVGMVSPEQLDGGEGPLLFARVLGIAGFISGAGFAVMLSFLERGRTIRDISLSRVALWGDPRRRGDSAAHVRRHQSDRLDLPARCAPRDVDRADRTAVADAFWRALASLAG